MDPVVDYTPLKIDRVANPIPGRAIGWRAVLLKRYSGIVSVPELAFGYTL